MEIVKGLHKLGKPDRLEAFRDAVSGDEVLPFSDLRE